MKRTLVTVAYGLGGLLLAVALTMSAYALAGRDIGQPAHLLTVPGNVNPPGAAGSPSQKPDRSSDKQDGKNGNDGRATSTPTREPGGDNGGSGDATESPSGTGSGERDGGDGSGDLSDHGSGDSGDSGEDD